MTRAISMMRQGDLAGSLRMNAMAAPHAASMLVLIVASVWATAQEGTPTAMWRSRMGRGAILALAGVELATLALWAARMLGCFGGPPPI
jgi:hypothetical protein